MNPAGPWFRLIAGLLAAAIALRLIIDLVRPALPYIASGLLLICALQLARWWRDRW